MKAIKELFTYSTTHGFSFLNDRLIECDIVRHDICFDADGRVDNHITVAHADWQEKITPDNFFASIADFKSNKPVDICRQLHPCILFRQLYMSCNEYRTYIIKGGKVVEYTIDFDTISVFFKDKGVDSVRCDDIPQICYKYEDDAKAHLSLEVENSDGTTKKIPSVAELVTLTDEQRSVVNEIVALSKKAKDMGVVMECDWNGVYAFNRNGIRGYAMQYDLDDYDERIDLSTKEFAIDLNVNCCSDEDMLCVIRKED